MQNIYIKITCFSYRALFIYLAFVGDIRVECALHKNHMVFFFNSRAVICIQCMKIKYTFENTEKKKLSSVEHMCENTLFQLYAQKVEVKSIINVNFIN